jgi:hypothetical protein
VSCADMTIIMRWGFVKFPTPSDAYLLPLFADSCQVFNGSFGFLQ